ncbi:hypothetical protein LCGC14_0629400 [marine sediment metagenome]|uniref:Uncharacterized protein n=1 Tax=marine sediment metagenome TaxID=412755 RepID=A0A0F9R2G8_9ZZZZ
MDINQKILEFAGFKLKNYRSPTCNHNPRCQFWITPDGRHWPQSELPDFTDPESGIAHLFKWVVPKLKAHYEALSIPGYCQTALPLFEDWVYECIIENKEPALSLCYAVEKLIDSLETPTNSLKGMSARLATEVK